MTLKPYKQKYKKILKVSKEISKWIKKNPGCRPKNVDTQVYCDLSKDPGSRFSYHSQFGSMINKERQKLNENLTLKTQIGNEEKDKIYLIKMKMFAL